MLKQLVARLLGRAGEEGAADLMAKAQALSDEGHITAAQSIFMGLLAREPSHRGAKEALARIAAQNANFAEALKLYDSLVSDGESDANIFYRRGNANNALGNADKAVADYDAALALDATRSDVLCNRGVALARLGRFVDSLHSYDQAIQINPSDYLVHYNRAATLQELRRSREALRSYDEAIRLSPSYAQAYINRGHLLASLCRGDEAIASYGEAIGLNAGFAEAFEGRGIAFEQLRNFAAAERDFEQALRLEPRRPLLRGQRRHAMMQLCDWRGLTEDVQHLTDELRGQRPASAPFPMLALVDAPDVHRIAAQLWAARSQASNPSPLYRRVDMVGGRIRIGYFSPDFRAHAVSNLVVGVLEAHDRSRFEVVAFAFGPNSNDSMRQRLESAFDHFLYVDAKSDAEVIELARGMELDIAIDLAGYTSHARPGIFAGRVAPIQINYLGYPSTLGAKWMDYIVGDSTVLTAELEKYYSEKFIVLPGSYLPYSAAPVSALQSDDRLRHGLPLKGFVYCCFNNSYKLTAQVFDVWMRILRHVPNSVIWLSQTSEVAMTHLQNEAVLRGVDPSRLVFAPRLTSHSDHLARCSLADLFLDTWPYNAHATAIDALYAGLPVLTLLGKAFAGRVAASLLHALSLPELVASSVEEFESCAIALSSDTERLCALRDRLIDLRGQSPVFDSTTYVRNLEKGYLAAHSRYVDGLAAHHIHIG